MISDLDLAHLEADTYSTSPTGIIAECGADRAIVCVQDGQTAISIRGTANPAGWISDFKAAGVRAKTHPQLGECEAGFLDGALALWPSLAPYIQRGGVIIQGHSRGAGMVPILAGLALISGYPPGRVVCWEAPWAVGEQCRKLLLDAQIPGVQYWNGDDPVPCIPCVPWLVPNVWPIKHIGSWMLNPFDCHSMSNIISTLETDTHS